MNTLQRVKLNRYHFIVLKEDGIGDVIGKSETSGNVLNDYRYEAFGNLLCDTASDSFGYCGEYLDNETGLIYLRARYYDSDSGRFISEDTHWNTDNMIYGDNQKAVKYFVKYGHKIYYDNKNNVVKIEKLHSGDIKEGYYAIHRTPDRSSIIQNANIYTYCVNNPVNMRDINGELAIVDDAVILVIAATAAVVALANALLYALH